MISHICQEKTHVGSLGLGLIGLLCFAWSVQTNQYDDPEGEAQRILDKLYDNHPAGKDIE